MTWPNLTSPDDAYLMGFLQTDGSNYHGKGNKGSITLELSARDVEVLEHLQRTIPCYTSVLRRVRATNFATSHESATLTICDLATRRALEKAGLPAGRKSASVAPPEEPLSVRDYVRGLVDGDGSIGFTAKGYPFVSFTTASTRLADYYVDQLREVTDAVRTARPNTRDGVANVMVTCEPAALWAAWLYDGASIALGRKATKACEVVAWTRPADMRARPTYGKHPWTPEDDALVLDEGLSQGEIAARLGRTLSSVSARRWRLRKAAGA
jgi:hypothetical protein